MILILISLSPLLFFVDIWFVNHDLEEVDINAHSHQNLSKISLNLNNCFLQVEISKTLPNFYEKCAPLTLSP